MSRISKWCSGLLLTGFLCVAISLSDVAVAQGLMTEATYNRLERVYGLMDEERFTDALEAARSARDRARNDHERAVIAQVLGFIHINMENYRDALDQFLAALEVEDALPVNPTLNIKANVEQLYGQFEEWERAIEYVDRYIDLVEKSEDRDHAPSRIYLVGAQAYMQMERWREALPYLLKAIEYDDEPREGHYRALLSIYFELNEYENAVDALETMLGYWPDNMNYWFQMFSLQVELGNDQEALSVLKLAHRKGLFDSETHYVNLYRMYMLEGAPYKAGQVMEDGIQAGDIPRNEQRVDMMSRAWIQAQEYDLAIGSLEMLSEIKGDGTADLTIAQLEQERANWDGAFEAANRAYERGGLDDPGRALLLAGRAAAERKDYDQALAVFERAMDYDESREQAGQWVNYIEEERAILGN